MEITQSDREVLKFLASGGIIALRVFGKTVKTIDIASSKRGCYVGMMSTARLEEAGFIRQGDPSPYKSGKSRPYLLTDAGRELAATLVTVS